DGLDAAREIRAAVPLLRGGLTMATAIKSRPVTSRLLAHLVPIGRLLGLVPPAPVTLAELRRRGLDARAQQVLRLLTGEHCDRSVFRKATREELWAFGF